MTIFPDTENYHLIKDVGQIPYFMYKTGGYQAELVSYKNDAAYPYLESEVRGLKLSFIEKTGRLFYAEKGVLKFLRSSARKIDILNLFHFKKGNILYLLLYKMLNPKGKTYVKLDIDLSFFRTIDSFLYSNYWLKNYMLKALTQLHFKMTDLFSVETEDARQYLLGVYPELEKKLICIPNGVDDEFIERNIRLNNFEQKENIIITVGRIGTAQKNTELFLESIRLTDLKDWKVYIIGPIEPEFFPYIDAFFDKNPHLEHTITFTGNITDRVELFNWYNRAKVFCLTSRHESFGIVLTEALYFGNYIITTPVSSAGYITQQGRHGNIVHGEAAEYSKAIYDTIRPGFLTPARYEETKNYAGDNFSWSGIIKKLSDKLKTDA